jgi:type IV secretion system protein VirB5
MKTAHTLLLCACLALPAASHAAGIPTFDYAAILQMMANAKDQAKQALDQLDAVKRQIDQAKSNFEHMKSITEGNSNLADVLRDPTLDSYLPKQNWRDIYSTARDLSSLRKQYGLTSRDPLQQKQYDVLLTNLDVLQQSYNASVKRSKNIEQLGQMLNTTSTPQQRADLENRLKVEQLDIENEKTRLDTLSRLTELNNAAEATARSEAIKRSFFGEK